MAKEKPWLTPEEQVAQLKDKGVSFRHMSENDAVSYLSSNNTYFRLRSYRTNFARHTSGANKGKYVNLDFAMLVDLAIIDMHLRDEMLKLALDIEHFSKVQLLQAIERNDEDGYAIVHEFANDQAQKGHPLDIDYSQGLHSAYIGSLIAARPTKDFPVWEFVEIVPFGRFVHFYQFCANRFDDRKMKNHLHMLYCVKELRNGCAHNSCILNDMKAVKPVGAKSSSVNREVTKALAQIGVGKSARQNKLSNQRLNQIATTLYLHRTISSSGGISLRGKGLRSLVERLEKHRDYYDESCPARSALQFIRTMICNWYQVN